MQIFVLGPCKFYTRTINLIRLQIKKSIFNILPVNTLFTNIYKNQCFMLSYFPICIKYFQLL